MTIYKFTLGLLDRSKNMASRDGAVLRYMAIVIQIINCFSFVCLIGITVFIIHSVMSRLLVPFPICSYVLSYC